MSNKPLDRLKHHVTGAIERGEKTAITAIVEPETIVVFRVFKKGGDVVALFPAEPWSGNGDCASYQHIGQHGAADYAGCIRISRPATPAEYAPLKRELERIGDRLKVQTRYTRRGK